MAYNGCTAPTWRLCHPVNIYVYRNGVGQEKPQLVHIPMEMKKNMNMVLEAIGIRMKLPVGYPIGLYNMDGSRVCKTYELEMYNNYVVVTNLEKRFKCVDYGCTRDPLVVIGRDSKHVNTLKFQNKKYDLFCRRKMLRKPLHELGAAWEPDGYGPCDLPSMGPPCGALCHKIMPTNNRPTQCCSDEIMCVEGNAVESEQDRCRKRERDCCFVPPSTTFQDKDLDELCNKVRCAETDGKRGETQADNNLMDLIKRYKDVGSDIFKMFQDKINLDMQEEISPKWQLNTGGMKLSPEVQQKMKEDLMKAAGATCQFSFDQYGNYIPSEGCEIPEQAGGGGGSTSPRYFENVKDCSTTQDCEGRSSPTYPAQDEASRMQAAYRDQINPEKWNSSQKVFEVGRAEIEVNYRNGSGTKTNQISNRNDDEEEEEQGVGTTGSQAFLPNVRSGSSGELKELVPNRGSMGSNDGSDKDIANKLNRSKPPPLVNGAKGDKGSMMEIPRNPSKGSPEKSKGNISPESGAERDDMTRRMPSNQSTQKARNNMPDRSQQDISRQNSGKPGTVKSGGNQNTTSDFERGRTTEEEYDVMTLSYEYEENPFTQSQPNRGHLWPPPPVGKKSSESKDPIASQNPYRHNWFHSERTKDILTTRILPPEGFDDNNNVRNQNIRLPPVDASPKSSTDWIGQTSSTVTRYPDVFIQQINELVQRHDNTKSTSPPPPIPNWSNETFTVEDKVRGYLDTPPRQDRAQRIMVDRSCGQSRTNLDTRHPYHHHRQRYRRRLPDTPDCSPSPSPPQSRRRRSRRRTPRRIYDWEEESLPSKHRQHRRRRLPSVSSLPRTGATNITVYSDESEIEVTEECPQSSRIVRGPVSRRRRKHTTFLPPVEPSEEYPPSPRLKQSNHPYPQVVQLQQPLPVISQQPQVLLQTVMAPTQTPQQQSNHLPSIQQIPNVQPQPVLQPILMPPPRPPQSPPGRSINPSLINNQSYPAHAMIQLPGQSPVVALIQHIRSTVPGQPSTYQLVPQPQGPLESRASHLSTQTKSSMPLTYVLAPVPKPLPHSIPPQSLDALHFAKLMDQTRNQRIQEPYQHSPQPD